MPVTTSNHQERRREIAALNAEQRANRTDAEQVELLIDRGHGHCAEAQRLAPVEPIQG